LLQNPRVANADAWVERMAMQWWQNIKQIDWQEKYQQASQTDWSQVDAG